MNRHKDLAQILLGDPPLAEAAGFLIRIKTAGWGDPPDQTGEMEGGYLVSTEQLIAACGEVTKMTMELCIAYDAFNASIRGSREALRDSWGPQDLSRYLMGRMSALGGALHLQEPEMPPGATEPQQIVPMMLRKEQEVLQALVALRSLIGEGNPMRDALGGHMVSSQSRIDGLRKQIPDSSNVVQALTPEDELAAADEYAAQAAPEEMPEELPEMEAPTEGLPEEGMEQPAIEEEGYPEEKTAQDAGDTPEQRFIAEARKQGLRAGARKGAIRGAAEGAVTGAGVGALTGRLLKGKGGGGHGAAIGALSGAALSSLGSAAAGAYRGRQKGEREALEQLKGASAKTAYALGALAGGLAGGATGYAIAPEQHKLRGTLGGVGVGALAGGGLQSGLGSLARSPARHNPIAESRKVIDEGWRDLLSTQSKYMPSDNPEMASILDRFDEAYKNFKGASAKTAQEGTSAEQALMSSPSGYGDQPVEQAMHYLASEQRAQQAQDMNEATHYRQRLQQAVAENGGLQQMMAQTQQQLAMLQQQASEAGMQIQQATQQAVQANDEALRHSQAAAQMRMGMQQMRAQMLEVASQDPDAIATQMQNEQAQAEAAAIQQQAAEQGGAMGFAPAPAPTTPQKAEEEVNQANNAQVEAEQQTMQARQAAEGAQMKMGAVDYANIIPPAIGAVLGAAGSIQTSRQGQEGLRRREEHIKGLEGKSGFANAVRAAKAKAGLAASEVAVKHPVVSALMGAGMGGTMGAIPGALSGSGLGKSTLGHLKNIGELMRQNKGLST